MDQKKFHYRLSFAELMRHGISRSARLRSQAGSRIQTVVLLQVDVRIHVLMPYLYFEHCRIAPIGTTHEKNQFQLLLFVRFGKLIIGNSWLTEIQYLLQNYFFLY